MQRLLFLSVIWLALALIPFGIHPLADDAHHPEKAAKAKKSTATKPKLEKRKPGAKTNKSNPSQLRLGSEVEKG